jgi:hypothetical protein
MVTWVPKDTPHTGALVATGFLAILVAVGVAYFRERRKQRGNGKKASTWLWALMLALCGLNALLVVRFVKKHVAYSDSSGGGVLHAGRKTKKSAPTASTNIEIYNSPPKGGGGNQGARSEDAGADDAAAPETHHHEHHGHADEKT